jgi:hypothetical protein
MKRVFAAAVALLTVGSLAQAEKADMSKITCDQLTHAYVDDVVVIGAWMSGYYNARRHNTVVDEKELSANAKKVQDYCTTNPKKTVMKAIEQISKAQ